ncbi:MAG: aromatic aminobenezylarsenical efflux permease ArsG family transporter, partial [Bacteroidales bacterium]
MEYLQQLVNSTEFPVLAAFILGIMTAVSPCPLATNISAVGFISKDVTNKRRVFLNGLLYTLGRAISYSVIGIILIVTLKEGASTYKIQKVISTYGELFIGPLLILIGVFMLDLIKIRIPFAGKFSFNIEKRAKNGNIWSSVLLGIVFALAFCPYSGVLYFGGLIPLSVSSPEGLFLPLIFALATGLPVIIFAWILAYSVSGLGSMYNKVKTFEYWFRRVVAVVFILVG